MKKVMYFLLLVIPIVFMGTMFYLDKQERNSSYSTPLEALENIENPTWEVVGIIDTPIYAEDNYAYVFFYSQVEEPYDYFVVSEYKKGKYGWKYIKMFGGGHIEEPNYGKYQYVGGSENGEQYGLAGSSTVSVKLGNREAELIPLNKHNAKIWFVYKPTIEQGKSRIMFFDKNGKLLN